MNKEQFLIMEFKVPYNAYGVSTRPSPGTDVLGGILYLTCFYQQNTLYKRSHAKQTTVSQLLPLSCVCVLPGYHPR